MNTTDVRLTADELDALIEEARELAFEEGWQEGHDKGFAAGYDRGRKDARTRKITAVTKTEID